MLINCNELLRLEALAKISSPLILNEPMLYLTLRKQILETLENGKDSVRDGSKTQFEQILDACALLGKACSLVGAKKDAEAFYRRAREGYVNLHGEDSEKALYATLSLFMSLGVKNGADIEKLKELAVGWSGCSEWTAQSRRTSCAVLATLGTATTTGPGRRGRGAWRTMRRPWV